MIVILSALAQVVAAPPIVPPISGPVATVHRDAISACAAKPVEDGDVVVCGRIDHGERYRLVPLTHRYDPVPGPGLGVKVGQGQANAYVATQQSPDGKPDKRIMVTLKLPF
ncbi:hypothetical protein QH494_14345 [Sphingomonas sp. AR_OL41]|uniref:hypothetical protein n=1 Tax=Sphingomonas sp. AR_OL41 TaxID=3042729 RepID=UPI00248191E7|nr:hypothetical protein [Sphingomonas sp. AR_OL41]MDH7973366.1 hypothetical protein [Sphingomonas sp. AR_OL41]